MSVPAASIAARIAVLNADPSIATLHKFSDAVTRTGQQSAKGLDSVRGSVGLLNSSLGVLGVSVGAGTLTSLGVAAGKAANSLELTDATIKAISGTTDRYNEVVRLAEQQQDLFGGSLEKNLLALKGLIPLSKNAGVALSDLNTAAQQLAASDPAQGFVGASFAIREFLSSNDATAIRSLAERFELPKDALRAIKEEGGNAADQIKALIDLMNEQGYTLDAVGARLDTTAQSYTLLGSGVSDLRDDIGGLLARAFEPLALGAAGLARILSGDLRAGMELMADATARAQGYSKEEAEARKEQILVGLDWLGVLPDVVATTDDLSTATDSAATAATYYAQRIEDAAKATAKLGDVQRNALQFLSGAMGDAIDRQSNAVDVAERGLRPYRQAVDDASDAVAAQQRAVRAAEQELRPYADAVSSAEDAVKAQERVVRDAEAALRPYADAVRAAEGAVRTQEDAVRDAEAALKPYERAVRSAQDAVRQQERTIADAEAALKPYEDAINRASDAVAEQEDRIRDAERGLERYEDAVERAERRLDRQTESVNEAKEAYGDLKDSISAAQREMDRLKGTPLLGDAALQAQLDAIEDEATRLELAVTRARLAGSSKEEIDALEQQLDQLRLQADELQLADRVANDDERRKIERFGEAMQEMTAEQIIAELERQNQAVGEMTAQLGPAEQAWQDATEAQDNAERSLRRSERALRRQKEAIEPLRDTLSRLKEDVDAAKDALQRQDDAIDPLRENLAGLKRNVDDARVALEEQNRAIDPLRENLELLKGRVDDARTALEEQDRAIDPLRDNLGRLKDRVDDARVALEEQDEAIDPLRDNLDKLTERLDDANASLEDQDRLINPLRDKLIDLKDKEADLNIQLGDQKSLLPDLNTEIDKTRKQYADLATAAGNAATNIAAVNDVIAPAGAPGYTIDLPGYRPGGGRTVDGRPGTIWNGTDRDDPRPSQAGIDTIVLGGSMGPGTTFDSPRPGTTGVHQGLDLQVTNGTPVKAPMDLSIVRVGPDQFTADGWTVIGLDRHGREWLFAHMLSVTSGLRGWIKKGTIIGRVGYGHVHVQLKESGKVIDPTVALESSALGASAAGDFVSMNAAGQPSGAATDPARMAEDTAFAIEASIDALRLITGYRTGGRFAEGMAAFQQDLTLSIRMLQDIASQSTPEGVTAAGEWAEGVDRMMIVIESGINSMEQLRDYQGIAPNLLDWFAADLRLVVDKLLDVARYSKVDGVTAAADLYEALEPVLGVVGRVVATTKFFQQYQGIMPNLLDWFGADTRLIVDKMLDIAQYYNADGVRAAAEVLEGATDTLKPISVVIATVDSLRQYKGVAPTILDWVGGDMRLIVDKVVDVAQYTGSGKEAADRLNETLLAVRQSLQTGMSLSDAVRNYHGTGDQAALFGDVQETVTQVRVFFDQIHEDAIIPWGEEVMEWMYLIGAYWMVSLGEGIAGDHGVIEAARHKGAQIANALKEGYGTPVLPLPVPGDAASAEPPDTMSANGGAGSGPYIDKQLNLYVSQPMSPDAEFAGMNAWANAGRS